MLEPISTLNAPIATLVTGLPSQPSVSTTSVLHIVNGEHFSGAERVQSHLGRCLPAFGFRADFALVKPAKFAEMLEQQQGAWGRGFRLPMQSRFDVRPAWQIRDLVQQHDYQLLHAHTPRTGMLAAVAAKLAGIPWVYHVHSPAARDSERQFTNRLNAWVERLSLSRCQHLITVSESLRLDCVARGFDEEAVSVVHNGVPGVRFERQSIPQPGGPWTIGMIALMRPRKGLEVVLESLAKLRQLGHQVRLRSIGPFETSEYETSVKSLADRLGVADLIEWQGFTDNVPEALSQLDAMVLPSLYGEGLPMVVLEAMAAAVPVVATRVEGTPEAITHGWEGLLAEPQDPTSLAEQIEALVTGEYDWQEMAEHAFDRHASSFSDLAMAENTAAVYRKVLALDN